MIYSFVCLVVLHKNVVSFMDGAGNGGTVCGLIVWEDDIGGCKASQAYGALAHNPKSSKQEQTEANLAGMSVFQPS